MSNLLPFVCSCSKFHYIDKIEETTRTDIRSEYGLIRKGYLIRKGFYFLGWYEFVRDHTTLWERYYTEWLEAERPVFLLYYEDLKTNLPATLKKLAHFLEWRVHKKDIDCTLVTSEGHFHRRHVHNITNSEIFVGKLWHKLEDAELNLAEIASERRKAGNYVESGTRLKNILEKADEEDKEDTSL